VNVDAAAAADVFVKICACVRASPSVTVRTHAVVDRHAPHTYSRTPTHHARIIVDVVDASIDRGSRRLPSHCRHDVQFPPRRLVQHPVAAATVVGGGVVVVAKTARLATETSSATHDTTTDDDIIARATAPACSRATNLRRQSRSIDDAA
jgi:hypothetical protein